jgi:hypothetical protein
MESKRFNPTILRKIREKIISVLKQSDIELQKHYQLSSINELSPNFTLTPILRSATPQSTTGNTSRIKKVLVEFFDESITF